MLMDREMTRKLLENPFVLCNVYINKGYLKPCMHIIWDVNYGRCAGIPPIFVKSSQVNSLPME